MFGHRFVTAGMDAKERISGGLVDMLVKRITVHVGLFPDFCTQQTLGRKEVPW